MTSRTCQWPELVGASQRLGLRGQREHLVGLLPDGSQQVVLAGEVDEVPLAHQAPLESLSRRDAALRQSVGEARLGARRGRRPPGGSAGREGNRLLGDDLRADQCSMGLGEPSQIDGAQSLESCSVVPTPS